MNNKVELCELADEAKKLEIERIISLVGNVEGEVIFDGTKNAEIQTQIKCGDITDTIIRFEESPIKEGIQSGQKTGRILGEIVNKFEEIEKGLESKLGKKDTATSTEKLSKEKNISLVGDITGTIAFDGSKDVEIQTEINSENIKDIVIGYIQEIINKEEIIRKILLNTQGFCFYNNKDVGIKNTGIIINTDIDKKEEAMIFISIRGNGYNSQCPIDTKVQVYNYVTQEGESYYNPSQLNNGLNIPAIMMFVNKDNKFSFYLEKKNLFESHWIEVYTSYSNIGNFVVNRVTTVDFAEEPPRNMDRMLTFDVIETVKKYQNQ